MRFDFASTTQTMATKFIGTELTGGTCVGCHALSRDGTRIVAEAGGQNDGRLLLLDVATVMPMVRVRLDAQEHLRVVGAVGRRATSASTATAAPPTSASCCSTAPTAPFSATSPAPARAANPADHPDWSLDGKSIAYVKVGTPGTNQRMWSGAIEIGDARPTA